MRPIQITHPAKDLDPIVKTPFANLQPPFPSIAMTFNIERIDYMDKLFSLELAR